MFTKILSGSASHTRNTQRQQVPKFCVVAHSCFWGSNAGGAVAATACMRCNRELLY
jgi:hypothetical protein